MAMDLAEHPSPDIEPLKRGITATNILLTALIIGGWLATHIYAVFVFDVSAVLPAAGGVDLVQALAAVGLMALIAWLYVGLFIVAHDCMHGVIVPFRPAINRVIGQICLGLYAGFSFDALNRKHHLHHRHAGTADDPDFNDAPPYGFWRWYWKFFTEYFGVQQFVFLAAVFVIYAFVFDVPLANIWLFWAIPAIVSSMQLFYYGTYEPHKPGLDAFTDRHRSRTSGRGELWSLLTCFHFGFHHEHHLWPSLPWWRLAAAHRLFTKRRA